MFADQTQRLDIHAEVWLGMTAWSVAERWLNTQRIIRRRV